MASCCPFEFEKLRILKLRTSKLQEFRKLSLFNGVSIDTVLASNMGPRLLICALLALSACHAVRAQVPGVLLDSVSAPPTVLEEVGCMGSDRQLCNATWVYCIDSYCDAPENGVSKCYCWIQAPGKSSLPASSDGGAPCVLRETTNGKVDNPVGDALCESMNDGELWSTFGYLSVNTSYLPPFAINNCPAETGMTYCWGAKCVRDPDPARPNGAICDCPYVTSNESQVDIQISVDQCSAQEGKTCDYLHNGNVAGVAVSEKTNDLYDLYRNLTGTDVPVIPTCEERPSTEPVSLDAIDCTDHVNYVCETTDTPWVYCIDAICQEPINGYSTCRCWSQAPGKSIAPGSAQSGATCVANNQFGKNEPYGEDLCLAMKSGTLVSTFGGKYGNTSFVPEFANAECDGGFAYCWGAICKQDPTNPDIAICECPFVSSEAGATIGIIKSQCAQQSGNECSYIHNGGPRSRELYDVVNDAGKAMGKPLETCTGEGFDYGVVSAPGPESASASVHAFASMISVALAALCWN